MGHDAQAKAKIKASEEYYRSLAEANDLKLRLSQAFIQACMKTKAPIELLRFLASPNGSGLMEKIMQGAILLWEKGRRRKKAEDVDPSGNSEAR